MRAFLIITFLSLFFITNAQKSIQGIVFIDENLDGVYNKGEQPLSNVGISNQKDIVFTDAKGKYSISLRDNAFIYVIKPSGYKFKHDSLYFPQFYYHHHTKGAPLHLKYAGVKSTGKAPKKLNFALYPNTENKTFKVLALGDPQTKDDERLNYFRDGSVNDMFRYKADFYIMHGDIADDNLAIYQREKQIMGTLGMAGYHVPGNHDVNFKSQTPTNNFATFHKEYGPDYYSFNYGDVHFIILNNISYEGWNSDQNKKGSYFGGLDEVQLNWLQNDLDNVADDKLIVINSHIPFLDTFTHKETIQQLHKLLKERPKVLSLSGHLHAVNTYQHNAKTYWNYSGTHEGIVVGATCGSWWTEPNNEEGIPVATCMDGSPKGYFVFEFSGSDYQYDFIPIHNHDDFQIRISLPSTIKKEDLENQEIVANWFIGKPHQKVELSISGRIPIVMENYTGTDPFIQETINLRKNKDNWQPRPAQTTHLWKAMFPEDLPRERTIWL